MVELMSAADVEAVELHMCVFGLTAVDAEGEGFAKKPIRVFLQEGENDLDNLHGSWPLANKQMAAALEFSGYDYKFVMGDGKHSGKHGGAILPDTLRWLWRDWKNLKP